MAIKSLIINPGSTSTKIGVFEDETLLFEETLRHSTEEISQYATIVDQKDFRKKIITDLLAEKNFDIKSLNVVVGRGGMLKPIPGGTYAVTDALLADLKVGVQGQHASNLGGILAREIADSVGVPSYIVDPVVVDELMPIARFSGVPELPRTSVFHFGEGRGVYISGLPYSFENSRLLYRAILWASGAEKELKQWFSSNYNVEVHAYIKNGKYCVVNNTYEPQSTTIYKGDGSSFELNLQANEIIWYEI